MSYQPLQLNPMEQVFYWGYQAAPGLGTATGRARVTGLSDTERLKLAVVLLGQRYPQLRAAIRTIRGVPQFVIDPQAPTLTCDIRHTADRHAWQPRVGGADSNTFQRRTGAAVSRGRHFLLDGRRVRPAADRTSLRPGRHDVDPALSRTAAIAEGVAGYGGNAAGLRREVPVVPQTCHSGTWMPRFVGSTRDSELRA